MAHPPQPISIRSACPDDADALCRLAALDSAPVPDAPLLMAEVGGELRAALSLRDGAVIADPFASTAHLVVLLEVQAAQLGESNRGGSRGRSAVRAAAAVWRGLTARERPADAFPSLPAAPESPLSLGVGVLRAP